MDSIIKKLMNVKYVKGSSINRTDTLDLMNQVRYILFPCYYEKVESRLDEYLYAKLLLIKSLLRKICSHDEENITESFVSFLPQIKESLEEDIEMYLNSDPAATNADEIILSYPGLYAITVYRIAHVLYKLGLNSAARIMTEEAHNKTGVDIHPGAVIGRHFFIDHGTGIVIGETSIIGDNIRIYQGVTLGAISISDAAKLKGVKRHPTIKDNVTIYSGASILGGNTVIGENVIIGCNAFINTSIDDNKIIINTSNEYIEKPKRD